MFASFFATTHGVHSEVEPGNKKAVDLVTWTEKIDEHIKYTVFIVGPLPYQEPFEDPSKVDESFFIAEAKSLTCCARPFKIFLEERNAQKCLNNDPCDHVIYIASIPGQAIFFHPTNKAELIIKEGFEFNSSLISAMQYHRLYYQGRKIYNPCYHASPSSIPSF